MKNTSRVIFSFCLVLLVINVTQAQWIQTSGPNGVIVFALTVNGNNLFAGTSDGVYLSTDHGATWTATDRTLAATGVYCFAISGTTLYAGTAGGRGVFRTTNNGTTWTQTSNGLTANYVYGLAVSDTNLFAGTYYPGLYLSTNRGDNWKYLALSGVYINAVAASGSNVLVGAFTAPRSAPGGAIFSTDYGASWVSQGLSLSVVQTVAISGNNLFAGNEEGLWRSTDQGSHWIKLTTKQTYGVYTIAFSDTILFVGSFQTGVDFSTDNGVSWASANTGLASTQVRALVVQGPDLFASFNSGPVWRRPLSQIITSVSTMTALAPEKYALGQNFPNPFNPSTTIGYSLTKTSVVSLRIFNTLGQLVATLVEVQEAVGYHQVQWSASNIPSGIYFYRFQAGEFLETRKMILLR